jgi:hypothetical protein
MDSTRLVQSTGGGAAVRAALKPTTEVRQTAAPVRTNVQTSQTAGDGKPLGYGLPCAKCKTYYLASLSACPICKSSERVSPVALIPARERTAAPGTRGKALDEEREHFLQDLKTKMTVHTQGNPGANPRCNFATQEQGAHPSATVCKMCYEELEERLDLFEAALHMDLTEAAQVIYDAVWADTSDSNKTYMNAARALLGELRKRAGLKVVLGSSLQPLTH